MVPTTPTVEVTVRVPVDLDLAAELIDIDGSSDAFATLREQIARALVSAHEHAHPALP